MRAAAIALTALLATGPLHAAPAVGVIDRPPADAPGCTWVAQGASPRAQGAVLVWSGDRATMQLDGHVVTFSVREVPCRDRCVAPGRRGVRTFDLGADTVRATLTKPVLCPRDAEVCSGLPAGNASLRVSTPRGVRQLTVRNEDCDPG